MIVPDASFRGTGSEMAQEKPYRFGDVVNGHRWTVMGWEAVEPTQPESVPAQPVRKVATVVDDRPTVHYAVGDEANGHRWTGNAWVPVEAAPAAHDSRVHSFGDVVDGHRWTIAGWEPVGASDLGVGVSSAGAASIETAGSSVASTPDAVGAAGFAPTPPSAGWYPG